MKTSIKGLLALALCLNLTPAFAQPGGGMGGPGRGTPQISAAMAKLFGDHQAFSASLDIEAKMGQGEAFKAPGKIAFDNLKSRFEMNLSEAKGGGMPPQMAAQMKSMGMDSMVIISRPDEKTTYMVYPGLKSYALMPDQAGKAADPSAFQVEITKLGEETVEGHPCVKNKATVTDDQGKKHESTIWNATDLKNFPVKIQTVQQGADTTLVFKNVKLSKPEASQFDPPAGFTKYENIMALMQNEVMKRMQQQGGMGE